MYNRIVLSFFEIFFLNVFSNFSEIVVQIKGRLSFSMYDYKIIQGYDYIAS